MRGVRPALAAGDCVITVPAVDKRRVTQGSSGTDVALGRPERLLGVAVGLERGGTVVMLVVMLTSSAFCCSLRDVSRSSRRRG